MDATLPALDRVVEKYRRDVHRLAAPATPEALTGLQRHLGVALPSDHARFLTIHNGVVLFRGALRIRSTAEIAPAHEGASVVLFADTGAGDANPAGSWAWVTGTSSDDIVVGRWANGRLIPQYASFSAFLCGEIAAAEAGTADPDSARFAAAGGDAWQLVRAAERALVQGDAQAAQMWLEQARVAAPREVAVHALLGEALAAQGHMAEAHEVWLAALQITRIPGAWPGAPTLSAAIVDRLASVSPDGWVSVLDEVVERATDVVDEAGAVLLESMMVARASAYEASGDPSAACKVLEALLMRGRDSTHGWVPWRGLMHLVDLHVAAGRHDAAEALLRQVRRHGTAARQGQRLLRLLDIVTLRQEPWAEDIVRELQDTKLTGEQALRMRLLRIERAVRLQLPDEAEELLQPLVESLPAQAERRAAVAMARADVAALRNDLDGAERAYLEGLVMLDDAPRHELALRIRLRVAELYRRRRDLDAAVELGREVAHGFAELGRPVREAWALVRLARSVAELRPKTPERAEEAHVLRRAARDRFVAADLAAGVAAVDSLAGQPGASLAWHLETATAQAKARHDAQRSRPPYTRADADRPERRLGAHRIAVAACDDGIVRALSQEMDACLRATRSSAGRATEPPVLRYIAAVDLLAGHRSYDAAKVLLDHLLHRGADGVMHRALQGAIARSPNAALVDGLLRCVEAPTEVSPVSVAAAAELLGLRREPAALPSLVRILQRRGMIAARRASLVAVGRIGDRQVVDALVPSLQDPKLAELAALSLLMLGDRRGVDFHGKALMEQRNDLSGSPGEIVGRYGGPDHLLLLVRASDGDGARALGALQGLGLLGDPRGVRALLRAMRAPSRRVVEVASGAMSILTGRDEDATEAGVRGRWTTWWERNAGDFPEGVRHRRGRVFDCGLLIGDMSHPDAYVRRTAYDELVITSGASLPFDADGPWRVQEAHLRAWDTWWATSDLEPGRWYLDGEAVH